METKFNAYFESSLNAWVFQGLTCAQLLAGRKLVEVVGR